MNDTTCPLCGTENVPPKVCPDCHGPADFDGYCDPCAKKAVQAWEKKNGPALEHFRQRKSEERQDELARLRSHAARLEEQLGAARGVLRDVEWEGEHMGRTCCPACGGLMHYEPPHRHSFVLKDDTFGHRPDCALKAALGEGK